MLHKLDNCLGLSLGRFIRPHQLPIGLAIMLLAPTLGIFNLA